MVVPSSKVRIQLDPHLGLPVYRQIVQQVQDHAARGRLRAGARLPAVRHLAQTLGVNFNTVARAYRLLARAGAISTQPGRGTFVLAAAPNRKSGRRALLDLATDFVARARRLQFSDAELMSALERALSRDVAASQLGENHE